MANVCVVSASDPKQRVLYMLDPAKGKGRELLRTGPPLEPGEDEDWDVSPDGSSLAFIKGDPQRRSFQVQVRALAGGSQRKVNINAWGDVAEFLRWAADGKGWYVTVATINGWKLLKIDLTGKAAQLVRGTTLGNAVPWTTFGNAVPSPDGRHVAMLRPAGINSNVWMLENF
jgi:hypothetical protein